MIQTRLEKHPVLHLALVFAIEEVRRLRFFKEVSSRLEARVNSARRVVPYRLIMNCLSILPRSAYNAFSRTLY